MAKTIDQRVVELGFDNKQFERGVSNSLDSIEQLKKGLKFDGATRGLEEVSRSANKMDFSGMGNAIDGIASKFNLMGVVAFTVIQRITNGILDMAKNIANAIIVDPIKTGLEEYETQINAIQTILANTSTKGTTMDDVTSALRELNTYADMTIYNFTEMTRNIGTFTAAGVDLDTSVAAIKGIANLAAVSGSTSQQAATAMYQLSQALSSGTVKLMDWNSVVNAGMGGQVFQDALKETARVHGIAIDEMIETEGSFRETLSTGWLTSEVLLETLKKFTGDLSEAQLVQMGYTKEQAAEILKLGNMANDAATKVKTLTQLKDTLKEALQSGWTQSWELIIGNFEQAKSLFTGISDLLGGWIGASAEARNSLLSLWASLGGRDKLVEALFNAFDALFSVIGTVKSAFADIFPPITAGQLVILTEKIADLILKFKMAVTNSEPLRKVFKAIFSVIDIGRMLIVSFVRQFSKFISQFKSVKGPLGDAIMKVADFLINLRNLIKEGEVFDKFFGAIFEGLTKAIGAVVLGVQKAITWFKGLEKINLEPLKDFFSGLKEKLATSGKFGKFLSGILDGIVKLIGVITPKLGEVKTTAKEVFAKIKDGVKNLFKDVDFSNLFSSINFDEVMERFKNIAGGGLSLAGGGFLVGILKAIKTFIESGASVFEGVTGILDGVQDTLKAYQNNLKADTLMKIAGAIAILALSLIALSFIDSSKLSKATLAISALFAGLVTTLKVFEKMAGGAGKMATIVVSLIGIATAILILSGALAIISRIEPDRMLTGVLAIGGLLAELSLFTKNVGGGTKMIGIGIGVQFLAAGILILAGSIALLGKIPIEQVKSGLLLLAGTMTTLALTLKLFPTNLPATGAGLAIVALSLLMLTTVLKRFGGMELEEVKTGLIALGGSLAILALSLNAMNSTLAGSAALLVASVAITVLSGALKTLGGMSLKQIGIGLLALAGVFLVIGVAGALLTPVVPTLLGLGGAMLLLGLAGMALGVGLSAAAAGLVALGTIGAAGAAAIGLVITGLAATLPFVAAQIGLALVAFFVSIANTAPQLLAALITLIQTGITALTVSIPEIVKVVLEFVTTLLRTLADKLPDLIDAGVDLILGLLDGMENSIGQVTQKAIDVVIAFMDAIGTKLPDLVDAGFDMLISIIDGISASVRTQTPRLISSVANLGSAIISGIISGVWQSATSLYGTIRQVAANAIASFRAMLGIQSPSTEFMDQARFMMLGVKEGLDKYGNLAYDSMSELGNNLMDKFSSTTNKLASLIDANVDISPEIKPVLDLSQVMAGTNDIQSMLDKTDVTLAAALKTSGSIASAMTPTVPSGEHQVAQTQQQLQFIQNNYSPKALSAVDLYRQTRNQLIQAKGDIPV